MRLAVVARKGGVGKTTTAVMLALLLRRTGPTVLVDADPQGSATAWRDVAVADGYAWPDSVQVVPWSDPMTLPPAGLSHVVIDTGPGDPAAIRAALALVDLALVPVGARAGDVIQLGTTVGDVERAAEDHPITWGVLLTMRDGRAREREEAPAAMAAGDLPAMSTAIPYGALYRRAFGTVPSRFGAYSDLLVELEQAAPALEAQP